MRRALAVVAMLLLSGCASAHAHGALAKLSVLVTADSELAADRDAASAQLLRAGFRLVAQLEEASLIVDLVDPGGGVSSAW